MIYSQLQAISKRLQHDMYVWNCSKILFILLLLQPIKGHELPANDITPLHLDINQDLVICYASSFPRGAANDAL